jgi:hypothetical protein
MLKSTVTKVDHPSRPRRARPSAQARIHATIRLAPVYHEQLRASAEAQGRSLSEEIETRLGISLAGETFAPLVDEHRKYTEWAVAACTAQIERLDRGQEARIAEIERRCVELEHERDALLRLLQNITTMKGEPR